MSSAATSAATRSSFKAFMDHPAGPRTVFFWAPVMKWCLVAAGVKDLQRPAEKLSLSQNAALALTGAIWVRYSLVITPLYRIWDWRRANPEAAAAQATEAIKQNSKQV
ncbi:unnamed protein product [Tilletia controversa]|nr:unnamed protein product [Tilletia controversa]